MESRRVRLIDFELHKDSHRGDLTVIEGLKDIPFTIRRLFYVESPGERVVERGGHAHKETEQVIICVRGDCKVMATQDRERKYYYLNNPHEGIYIPEKTEVVYTVFPGALILVLSSTEYDPDDYIFFDEEGNQ